MGEPRDVINVIDFSYAQKGVDFITGQVIYLGGVYDRIPSQSFQGKQRGAASSGASKPIRMTGYIPASHMAKDLTTSMSHAARSHPPSRFFAKAIALFLALIEHSCILVPLTNQLSPGTQIHRKSFRVKCDFHCLMMTQLALTRSESRRPHELYSVFTNRDHPGRSSSPPARQAKARPPYTT